MDDPRAKEKHGEKHHHDLGDEAEGLFVDLGGCLEGGDQKADQKAGDQHRR